jgi:hypothetical protein
LPNVEIPTKTDPHVQKIDFQYLQREKDFALRPAMDRAFRCGSTPWHGVGHLSPFASRYPVASDPLI